MNKTNIDWPGLDYTWNPVTGCKRNCDYCYARRIWNRFHKGRKPFSEIIMHWNRLNEPLRLKKPAIIFVGSMSDIEYWDAYYLDHIFEIIKMVPQHTFMFLSKNPRSYLNFKWPKNTMQGLTMTCCQSESMQLRLSSAMNDYPHPYFSLEPLLGNLQIYNQRAELWIVGTNSLKGALPPMPEWIERVKLNIPADKIYWKSNIRKYLTPRHGVLT